MVPHPDEAENQALRQAPPETDSCHIKCACPCKKCTRFQRTSVLLFSPLPRFASTSFHHRCFLHRDLERWISDYSGHISKWSSYFTTKSLLLTGSIRNYRLLFARWATVKGPYQGKHFLDAACKHCFKTHHSLWTYGAETWEKTASSEFVPLVMSENRTFTYNCRFHLWPFNPTHSHWSYKQCLSLGWLLNEAHYRPANQNKVCLHISVLKVQIKRRKEMLMGETRLWLH